MYHNIGDAIDVSYFNIIIDVDIVHCTILNVQTFRYQVSSMNFTTSKMDVSHRLGLEPAPSFVYPCVFPKCKAQFKSGPKLHQHIRRHIGMDGDLECPICGNTFTTITKFVRHAWSCSGIRPFGCPFRGCEYAASQKVLLKNHLLSKVHQLSIHGNAVFSIVFFHHFILLQG